MTTAVDIRPCLKECLATFEAFRRLGFEADDIFLRVTPMELGMELHVDGKSFVVPCGMRPIGDVNELWLEAAAHWKDGPESDRQEIWSGSYIANHSTEFLLAMAGKGLYPVKSK